MDKLIEITQSEYDRLKERDEWLICLEAAGVDNWSGYEYAIQLWHGDEDDD